MVSECWSGWSRRQQRQPDVIHSTWFWWSLVLGLCAVCTIGHATDTPGHDEEVLVWVKSPQPTALVEGGDLILACEVRLYDHSYPPSSSSSSNPKSLLYTWTKDSVAIPPKASTYSNHSLFVPRVGEADLGQYMCTVTVGGGWDGETVQTSASANVILAYLDPFLVHPESQTIEVGQPFVLTCVTGQSAPHLEVYWTKDGDRFHGGTQMTAAFGDFDEDGLRLQTSMRLDVVASPDSTGLYRCVAWNKLVASPVLSNPADVATESVPSNLLPVIEWTQPDKLVIAEGRNLTLGCSSQVSTEPVEVNWFLGRYLVDESKRVYVLLNASLAFLPVSARDRGFYHCRAANSKGTVRSPEVELVIAYILIQFQEEPSNTFALYGRDVVLKCQPPDSLPTASVTWYKDYAILDTTSRPNARVIDNDLHLSSVTRSDVGSYYCVATNPMTNPSSRTSRVARLTIQGPPQIIQPPIRTELLKGSLLHLSCLAESDPPPTVTWTFQGRSLTHDDDVNIMNQGQELWIADMGKAWEGEFSCLCSNQYGSISASALVTIIVPPVSLHPIGVLRATTGSALSVSCPVDGFPLPSVQWFHNDTAIELKNRGGGGQLTWDIDGLDLVISKVMPDYSGTYRCDANNEGGTVTSSGSLVVYVPPYILESPQDISIVRGKRGQLTCRAEGNEPPIITWSHNNSLPVGGVLNVDNTTLTFPSLGWNDVGLYTCTASNGVGKVKRSATVSVEVPPSIVSTSHPDRPVKIKSQFVLTCGTTGLPPPAIKWTHHNVPILPSLNGRVRFPMAGMLVVESAQEKDAGVYKCIAESQAGTDTASFSVSVYGRPHPPTLLAAVPLSSTSVYLLWQWAPTTTTDGIAQTVDSFKIFFRKKSSEDVEMYPKVFRPNETRVEVMPLDPGIPYVFYLKAVNDAGTSEPSNLLTAVTFHSAPSAPTNLRVLDLRPKSAVVSWEPPSSPNGVVKRYQLRFKRDGVISAYQTINIDAPSFPTQEVTLQSLRPFYNYSIQTRAATLHDNQELWGSYSPPLLVQTKMTVPSLPPQFVQATPIDANAISVLWEPVPDLGKNGPITGYFVLCHDDQKTVVASHRVDKSLNRRSVYGLSPWRQYWVSVKGENLMGVGSESKPVSVRTLPLAPVTVPQQFTAESHSSTSITLSWKPLPSSSITCDITAYVVRYRRKQDDTAWITQHISSNHTTHTLIHLRPWTAYEFSVAAFTDSLTPGLGPYTQPIMALTLQGESSPVTALSFRPHARSISLSWGPPLDAKGRLIGYSVQYQIVFIENSAKSRNTSIHSTTCLLSHLLPNTTYNISIAARNEERTGQATLLLVKTLPLSASTDLSSTPVLLALDSLPNNVTSATTFGAVALQEEDEIHSHVKRNLASIVAGSIIGAIVLIILLVFICAQCKKYRKKQRLSYDVDEEGAVQQHNEQTTSEQQAQHEPIAITTDSTTTTTTTTTPQNPASVEEGGGEGGDLEGINQDGCHQHQQTTGDSTMTNQQADSTDGKNDKPKISGLRRLSKPSVFQSQGYSKLDEDGGTDDTTDSPSPTPAPPPPTQPVPVPGSKGQGLKTVSSSVSVDGMVSAKPADDTISIMSDTLKRRSRMRSESAAAIAMLRNSQVVTVDDSEGLIDNEIHAEVIFNERTVL